MHFFSKLQTVSLNSSWAN